MSAYRANVGFGVLPRSSTDNVGEMPQGRVVWDDLGAGDCIHQLTHRFGAGIDISINRNRNNNYLQDIGYREFTSATSGMYDIDFTVNGAFVPEMSSWLEFVMMSEPVIINNSSVAVNSSGTTVTPSDSTAVYVKNTYTVPQAMQYSEMPTSGISVGDVVKYTGDSTSTYTKNNYYKALVVDGTTITWKDLGTTATETSISPILYGDFKKYKGKTVQQIIVASGETTSTMPQPEPNNQGNVYKYMLNSANGYETGHYYKSDGTQMNDIGTEYNGAEMEFHVYSYINMDGPKYFDVGYQQVNENTTNGGLNEIGVLTGCVIDSCSINYESGSDVQIKFSLSIIALNEYIYTTSDYIDYNAILDYTYPLSPLVAGCVSTSTDGTDYETIAQTDSAGISINNNLTKLGNCLKLTYSSVALGALGIEMNISTYSNDPNKFLAHMYGYSSMTDGMTYSIAKQPYQIPKMKIRSDNSSSIMVEGDQLLDLNLTGVYVGSANRTYNVDNAIMDEPDLRPRRVQIVTGFKTPTN